MKDLKIQPVNELPGGLGCGAEEFQPDPEEAARVARAKSEEFIKSLQEMPLYNTPESMSA